MSEWQTIDTAPKDWRPVILWDGKMMVIAAFDPRAEEWLLLECNEYEAHPDSPIEWTDATHWMPLPPPPSDHHDAQGGGIK